MTELHCLPASIILIYIHKRNHNAVIEMLSSRTAIQNSIPSSLWYSNLPNGQLRTKDTLVCRYHDTSITFCFVMCNI